MKKNNKRSKYIIISIDALRSEDLDFLKTLTNFSKIIDNGSVVKKVTSIYPSVTYPCHASIITGCYPDTSADIPQVPIRHFPEPDV